MEPTQKIDINALKAKIDAEIAARLLIEADAARYVQRRAFRIGGLRLLVRLDATSEVVEMPTLFRLPGAPAGIKGLANSHGRVVPVLDLSILYGLQNDHDRATHKWLLVCGRGEAAVGLSIDNLPERKRFMHEDRMRIEDIVHPMAGYVTAAYRDEQDVWIDLDTEKLFAAIFHVEPSSV